MGTKGCKISFSKDRFPVINHCSPQHNRLSYLWVSLRGQTGQIQPSQVALLWIYSCCLKHMWFCLEAGCAPCPFSPLILRQSFDTHLFLCISDFCFLSFTFFLFVISCCTSIWWEYNKLPLPTFHVYMFVFGLCVCVGVPDLSAEKDCCPLCPSECWAGGQESVCQRGTGS